MQIYCSCVIMHISQLNFCWQLNFIDSGYNILSHSFTALSVNQSKFLGLQTGDVIVHLCMTQNQ